MEKPFKILSIDGGGIKGLYSSKILEHFEEEFQCNLVDYFDMICGTSTGGILGLALSLKLKAAEISKLYEEKGDLIFPPQSKIRGIFKQTFRGGKYGDEALKEALEATFGEHKIGDSNCLLCIPSYSLTDARPFVFKYDHKEGNLSRDNMARYVDVALATSAAPTYFPLAEIKDYDNKQFVDGGLYANNPSIVGFIEALTYFVGEDKEYDEVQILSISSLTNTVGKNTGLARDRAFIDWRDELFDTMLTGQAKFIEYFMSKVHEINAIPVKHIRVPSEILSPEQQSMVKLDKATKQSIDLLKGKGNDMGIIWRKKDEIKQFFETEKTYKTN
ncbi:patatin [Muricauda sp. HICW]|uniref:Patatin n=1 Tax=Flagellimonas chongwuensis TaxID=2697365 RepID=A0A850NDI0_9FLAO|nr:CBASS cGAMP-activated phospholipase [Allomuricauda chongwuensis]NVN18034.1 patatin [Allomuricauda chongwuensis]